jgi:hypothetical protein
MGSQAYRQDPEAGWPCEAPLMVETMVLILVSVIYATVAMVETMVMMPWC